MNASIHIFLKRYILKLETIPIFYSIAVLLFVTFIIYGNSLQNGFVGDDQEQIIANTSVQDLANIPQLFSRSTMTISQIGNGSSVGEYYKPIMFLVYTIIGSFSGVNPFGFHLFSVCLHSLNVVLLFLFLKIIFKNAQFPFPKLFSFFLALLFAIHPVNTEAVSYIASQQELLYVCFLLCSLLIITWISKTRWSLMKTIFVLLGALLASLLSKDSGLIVIPLVLLFTGFFFRSKLLWVTHTSFIAATIYLFLRFAVAHVPIIRSPNMLVPIAQASIQQRLQTIPYELFSYFRVLIFPKDLFIQQHFVIRSLSDPRFLISLAVSLILLVLLLIGVLKFKSALYNFFLLWILLTFSIILNIYPLDMTFAERWMYGPLIGILGLVGTTISLLSIRHKNLPYFFLVCVICISPFLGIRTFLRNGDWKDNMTLYSHDIFYNNGAFDLQNAYGNTLAQEGNLTEARRHFETSIKLAPNWWLPYANLGTIYYKYNDLETAKKMSAKSVALNPYFDLGAQNLAILKYKTEDPKSVIAFTTDSLHYLPNNVLLNIITALSYYLEDDTQNALQYARRASAIEPSDRTNTVIQRILNNQSIGDIIQ